MAKIKLKGVNDLAKKLNRSLQVEVNKLFRDKTLREEIGRIVVEDIKANYDGGSPAKSTLKWRERYDKLNATDPAYNRNKIKAVFTGELLEDLRTNIKADTTQKQFVMEHSGKLHKKYQGVTKKIGSRTPYNKISEYLIDDMGYNYLQLTDEAREKIVSLVRDKLYRLITNI